MSRMAFAAVAILAVLSVPAGADDSAASAFGLPIAPNGGKASLHQWGALDDAFAVNPDGDEDASAGPAHKFAPMAQDQDDQRATMIPTIPTAITPTKCYQSDL